MFTTRPDTLMGATYLAIAAEHPLALKAAQTKPLVAAFIDECRHGGTAEADIETQEKKGIDTGLIAIHPVTGEKLPVWIANFVLMGYGTGAVMAVPGHDQRDWEFATKYDLLIKMVIVSDAVRDAIRELGRDAAKNPGPDERRARREPRDRRLSSRPRRESIVEEFERAIIEDGAYTEYGWLVNSGEYDGLDYRGAFDALAKRFEEDGRGARRVNYRLRDWGVSRQRYWGCPIPIIYCAKCGAVPVPEDQLPVRAAGERRSSPACSRRSRPIPNGARRRVRNAAARPSARPTPSTRSWSRAGTTRATRAPARADMVDARANYWLPVDQYIGGIEHAILHLAVFPLLSQAAARRRPGAFATSRRRICCARAWSSPRRSIARKRRLEDVDQSGRRRDHGATSKARIIGAVLKADGKPVEIGGIEKMSKSKNNGVDPQSMVDKYGADTVRLFSMFAAPPEQSLEWNEAGVEGMARFLRRFWREVTAHAANADHPVVDASNLNAAQKTLRRQVHETIQKVSDDIGRRYAFNTAIAALMELLNAVAKFDDTSDQGRAVRHEALEAMVLLLNPVTPHICHALWQVLGHRIGPGPLDDQPWPRADPAALTKDTVTLAMQVNGKLRGTIEVAVSASREEIERAALAEPKVADFVGGATPKKIIVVPGKIVNIVI